VELRALTLAALLMLAGCSSGDSGPYDSAEAAVRAHLAAARSGDVAALRSDSCGALAEEMARHSDDEVRVAFDGLYSNGPDELKTTSSNSAHAIVAGLYLHVTDLGISFSAEDHGGWKVCDIHPSNGPFGPLPGPFQRRN
jgi:hypothetical protein